MNQLNLCIDIDGTMTEAYDWIPMANDYFNTRITPEKVKIYEIHKILGIHIEAYNEFYRLHGELMHEEVRIRIGVKDVLDRLYENHRIHIVSAREDRMKNVTEKWLRQHEIPKHTLSLLGTHNKVSKAQELCCDLFVEDRYENAVQLASYGFNVLLIDCNYNQGHCCSGITRVMNWLEIDDYIEDYVQICKYSQIAT
ncbi:hypothetical protein [Acetobacterium sp.]|uniref:hypothetical protein n=1 Tax=Acetobacterium sp. TaxID=1872094 RepID=UPI002F405A56